MNKQLAGIMQELKSEEDVRRQSDMKAFLDLQSLPEAALDTMIRQYQDRGMDTRCDLDLDSKEEEIRRSSKAKLITVLQQSRLGAGLLRC